MKTAYVCEACEKDQHDECIDIGDIDGYPMCSCEKGDCKPMLSFACTEWLHNCPGCPCSCHEDQELRAAWTKVHRAWVHQMLAGNKQYGPAGVSADTSDAE